MKPNTFFLLTTLFLILLGCKGNNTPSGSATNQESPYGDWKVGIFLNDFDEPTGEKYIYQELYGHFSNSATTNSRLRILVKFYCSNGGYKLLYGRMFFDEYCDGIWDYVEGPSKDEQCGSKIIDREHRRAFHRANHDKFSYMIDGGKGQFSWEYIFADLPATYEVTITGDYKTKYFFSINTDKLSEALATECGYISSSTTKERIPQ